MSKIIYPIRINKYLAAKNICSRRRADEFISQKLVLINNRIAQLGAKVNAGDKVTVNPKINKFTEKYVYLAYNKPVGVASHLPPVRQTQGKPIRSAGWRTQGKQKNEIYINDNAEIPKDVFPIGRLDKKSHGLLILTNDGRITAKLLDPKFHHEKEYEVLVNKPINNNFISRMQKGIKLENFTTRACQINKINKNKFSIVLTEGKKHQIRRMCTALGYEVNDLQRIRIGRIKLENIPRDEFRPINPAEIRELLI